MPYYYFANILWNYIPLTYISEVNYIWSFLRVFDKKMSEKKNIELLPQYRRLLVDSGVYTFRTNPSKYSGIDLDYYVDKYIEFLKEVKSYSNFIGYFEVDLYSDLGVDGVRRIREKMEDRLGIKAIPVWQPDEVKDAEFPYRLVEDLGYDYIAISIPTYKWVRKVSVRRKLKLMIVKVCADLLNRYGTKIHLLGLHFKDSLFDLYKYYSFDNSNSFDFARPGSGILYLFDGEKLGSYSFHQLFKEKRVRYKDFRLIYQIVFENIFAYAKKLEQEG